MPTGQVDRVIHTPAHSASVAGMDTATHMERALQGSMLWWLKVTAAWDSRATATAGDRETIATTGTGAQEQEEEVEREEAGSNLTTNSTINCSLIIRRLRISTSLSSTTRRPSTNNTSINKRTARSTRSIGSSRPTPNVNGLVATALLRWGTRGTRLVVGCSLMGVAICTAAEQAAAATAVAMMVTVPWRTCT